MRSLAATALASALLVFAGCGSDDVSDRTPSGVTGRVTLGPTCPVESAETPCPDRPAANAAVIVSEALPGAARTAGPTVAEGTTDSHGYFRIAVHPGDYIVTARAGMSCEPVGARVPHNAYVTVALACDTGIR